MNGAGAALGGENIAVSLQDVHPQDVAEAIQIGPGQMPVGGGMTDYEFGTAQSQQDVDDIAAYLNVPVYAAFHEWVAIGRDLRRARSAARVRCPRGSWPG